MNSLNIVFPAVLLFELIPYIRVSCAMAFTELLGTECSHFRQVNVPTAFIEFLNFNFRWVHDVLHYIVRNRVCG
jgi:hypothetical protein